MASHPIQEESAPSNLFPPLRDSPSTSTKRSALESHFPVPTIPSVIPVKVFLTDCLSGSTSTQPSASGSRTDSTKRLHPVRVNLPSSQASKTATSQSAFMVPTLYLKLLSFYSLIYLFFLQLFTSRLGKMFPGKQYGGVAMNCRLI